MPKEPFLQPSTSSPNHVPHPNRMPAAARYFPTVATAFLLLVASAQSFLLPAAPSPRHASSIRMAVAATATQHVVVGKGRVGEALAKMIGPATVLVGRTDPIPAEGTGPIYVATRNDDLAGVIEKTPVQRRKDLVFLQNGMLGPFLESHGLGDNTQVLVYFAVAKKGEAPTDGVTDLNPEGLTAANGPWAADLAATLKKAGLSCRVLDKGPFRAAMFEKLIWISVRLLWMYSACLLPPLPICPPMSVSLCLPLLSTQPSTDLPTLSALAHPTDPPTHTPRPSCSSVPRTGASPWARWKRPTGPRWWP